MANESDPTSSSDNAKSSVEDLEKYLLHTHRKIVPLLKAMATKPDLITATIPATGHSIITAVLDVLPKKNLVVLDYGPNEALNKKLLEADKIIFTTRHDLVETRFSCNRVQRVKYKNGPAFATLIPDSVMYFQRREYFRIKPLISHPVFCRVERDDALSLKLKSIDIGVKGISLQDNASQLQLEPGDILEKCKLTLPANPSLTVDLQIRYTTGLVSKEGQEGTRIGANFIGLQQKDEFTLQRFINMVQMEQKALARS